MVESSAQLIAAVLRGETRAVARACRIVDEGWAGHVGLLSALYPHAAKSWCIGVTGSPGVGKSTLTSRLVQHLRARKLRVGVVAVDPTSPFSGGAILGDRIRMVAHFTDPDVFIRSVATRGALGGLSRTAADIVRVLGAWGAEVVLLETVGVGQDELDVMRVAHSTLVVQAPGAGDDVQAAKAGLLECADVFAVNKADLPGAEAAAEQLRSMLMLGHVSAAPSVPRLGHSAAASLLAPSEPSDADAEASWEVPVTLCVAARDEGVGGVLAQLDRHHQWLSQTALGRARRARRVREELIGRIREALSLAVLALHQGEIENAAERVMAGEIDPYAATRDLVGSWTAHGV